MLMMFGSSSAFDEFPPDDGPEAFAKASLDADAAASEGFCSPKTLWKFLEQLEGGYRQNAYHNFQDAVDVTHTVYRYLVLTACSGTAEKFTLMVAALAPLDHPGVSNAFLHGTRATRSPPCTTLVRARERARRRSVQPDPHQADGRRGAGSGDGDDAAAAPRTVVAGHDLYARPEVPPVHEDMSHHFKGVADGGGWGNRAARRQDAAPREERGGLSPSRRATGGSSCRRPARTDIERGEAPRDVSQVGESRADRIFRAGADTGKAGGRRTRMDAAVRARRGDESINFMEFVVAPLSCLRRGCSP